MRKIQVLVISILFLSANTEASFLKSPQPYAFGPEGRSVSDLKDFAKPVQVSNILPNRPVASTDASGARVYYSSSGRQMLSVSKDGQTTFSVGGVTKTRDKQGNIISVTERQRGTNVAEIKDSFGEIVGYKVLNANGSTSKELDKDGNVTKTYNYDKFGKTITSVVNELTKQKTLYDTFGREKGVIDMGFGGDDSVISTCQYDDICYEISQDGKSIIEVASTSQQADAKLLVSKKTYSHEINNTNSDGTVNISRCNDTIYYDREGAISKVVDAHGIVKTEYFYKKDNQGNKVLTYTLNPQDKTKTYYENGKAVEDRNDVGGLTKKYFYDGARLLYTVEMTSDGRFGDTTYYDISGKAINTTHKLVGYNSPDEIDYVCGAEYAVTLTKAEVREIEAGKSSMVEGRDYIIRIETNPETSKDENVYYKVPTGIEGVNYVRETVKNEKTGKNEIKFFKITEKYYYKKDETGNKVIDYVVNLADNTRTYYKNNKMYYTAANDESTRGINISQTPNDPRILRIFQWDVDLDWETPDNKAKTLRYVFDVQTQTTQWFNAEAEFVYLAYNDRLVSKNIYDRGQLAGVWNNQTNQLTIFRDEKRWITVNLNSEPDVALIRKLKSFITGKGTYDFDRVAFDNYLDYYITTDELTSTGKDNLLKYIDTQGKFVELKSIFEKENKGLNRTFIEYLQYKNNPKNQKSFRDYIMFLDYEDFKEEIKNSIYIEELEKEVNSFDKYHTLYDEYTKYYETSAEPVKEFIEYLEEYYQIYEQVSKEEIATANGVTVLDETERSKKMAGYIDTRAKYNTLMTEFEKENTKNKTFTDYLDYKLFTDEFKNLINGKINSFSDYLDLQDKFTEYNNNKENIPLTIQEYLKSFF